MWKVIILISVFLSFTKGKSCFGNLLPFFECKQAACLGLTLLNNVTLLLRICTVWQSSFHKEKTE